MQDFGRMSRLHQVLGQRVDRWRSDGYRATDHPAIAEILEWARDETGSLRYLRRPQLRALETYWYLRLVEKTPHVFDLYRRLFSHPSDLMAALGLASPTLLRQIVGQPPDDVWDRIKMDDAFVGVHRLESLRETLTLGYPSYILALAMGAGKTILIGAIFATEFAIKEAVRRSDLGGQLARGREDEARAEVANLRLQAIASLPHLAVFSDEAHHTYGQSL